MKRTGWSTQQFNEIKWEYISHAFSRGTTNQKKAYIKIMHKLWATDKHKSKISNHTDHRCKRCNHLHEDWDHIFRCQSTENKQQQRDNSQQFQKFLQQIKFSPPMITVILHCMKNWINNKSIQFPYSDIKAADTPLKLIHKAFISQTSLGWDQFFAGRISSLWFQAHDYYASLRYLKSQYSSNNIGPKLVQQPWSLAQKTWGKN